MLWTGEQPIFGGGYANSYAIPHMNFARNLYWDTEGHGADFGGFSLPQWETIGIDRESRIADPQFVDSSSRRFPPSPTSTAFALGFEPFDPSLAGPRHLAADRLTAGRAYPEQAAPIVESRLEVVPAALPKSIARAAYGWR